MNQPCRRAKRHRAAPTQRRALRVDPLLAVPLDRCVARCTGGKGCTWGPCAGDVRGARAPGMYVGPVRRGCTWGSRAGDVRGARAPGMYVEPVRRGCTWGPRAGDVRGARAPGMYVGPVRRGCTWGPRAGGLSPPRQRPPAIISWRPCRGLSMRALGRGWRADHQGRSADVLGRSPIRPTIPRANTPNNEVDQAPTGAPKR
jgi:hypothetical protein